MVYDYFLGPIGDFLKISFQGPIVDFMNIFLRTNGEKKKIKDYLRTFFMANRESEVKI